MPQLPKDQLAQLVLQYCKHFEIEHVVISPGSRNAPLTIGFSNVETFNTLQIVDERCAAFFALGIAQQTQKPVVLLCTSGSAVLNYFPAVAEAYYAHIPLIVISADRPAHLIDIGDGQTINQKDVFGNHVWQSIQLKNGLDYNQIESENDLNQAFQSCIKNRGPVHINIPFDEPLYETQEEISVTPKCLASTSIKPSTIDDKFDWQSDWHANKKKMILVGMQHPNSELNDLLGQLVEDDQAVVLTETTANLSHPKFINSIDKIIFSLEDKELEDLKPELLITVGGMIVSKKIKQFLRKHQPAKHWHIGTNKANDTFFCLSNHLNQEPQEFFRSVVKLESKANTFINSWMNLKAERNKKGAAFLRTAPYSDLLVFQQVLSALPAPLNVQLSNSSVVRYHQLFNQKPQINVFCNRGTSGIDGSTSTAIGAAYASKLSTVLITGDISFFYDSNAFWNNYIPSHFKVILINNGGGGIFRFIPGPSKTNALSYFETPHHMTAEHLCNQFGLTYRKALNLDELNKELPEFFNDNAQPQLIEIFTPSEKNDEVLKAYFNALD